MIAKTISAFLIVVTSVAYSDLPKEDAPREAAFIPLFAEFETDKTTDSTVYLISVAQIKNNAGQDPSPELVAAFRSFKPRVVRISEPHGLALGRIRIRDGEKAEIFWLGDIGYKTADAAQTEAGWTNGDFAVSGILRIRKLKDAWIAYSFDLGSITRSDPNQSPEPAFRFVTNRARHDLRQTIGRLALNR